MMKKLFFLLLLGYGSSYAQTQIGADINAEAASDRSGWSVSMSSDGSIVAIGAITNSGNGSSSGHVRIYQNSANVWTQIGSDINGEAAFDSSGQSVSLSADGSIVAIGAIHNAGNGSFSGHVRVYQNVSGMWTQIGSDINGEAANDQSGESVSLSSNGNILAIGAFGNSGNGPNSGHVRIYRNISNVWTQIGSDINGEAANDYFGRSVSISADGSIVAIGADGNDENGANSGHVRIYRNISNVWTQIGSDINGEAADDNSGSTVSLSVDGSIVAIGAGDNDGNGANSGHVRIYRNISNVWTQIGSDINGEAANDNCGRSVSISADGSIVAIGADGNGADSGHVRIYRNISNVWTQIGSDINGEAVGDQSGFSVSLSSNGSVVSIGAVGNTGNGADSGHVRVYDLSALLSSDSFVLENFNVFPNPTSEKVTITLQESLQLEKVNIYNTLGQLIKTEKNSTINVTSLSKGSNYFEVITNQGKATKTIVVQ